MKKTFKWLLNDLKSSVYLYFIPVILFIDYIQSLGPPKRRLGDIKFDVDVPMPGMSYNTAISQVLDGKFVHRSKMEGYVGIQPSTGLIGLYDSHTWSKYEPSDEDQRALDWSLCK